MLAIIRWSILASSTKMADLAGVRLVVFRVANLACAVEASVVREILPAHRATRIPGADDAVEGLINVRSRLLTLIDASRALNQPHGETDGSVVLLDVGEQVVGFAVDEVLDLFSVAASDLAERGDLPGIDPRLVRAIGRQGDLSFILLDIDALLEPILTA